MFDLQSIVFTKIKYSFPDNIKSKYQDLKFTTTNVTEDNPKFPTVYVHEMAGREIGTDLQGLSINGVESTFQIDVYDNKSPTRAKEVMEQCVLAMKSMRYRVTSMPEFDNQDNSIFRSTARFTRVVGSGDTI